MTSHSNTRQFSIARLLCRNLELAHICATGESFIPASTIRKPRIREIKTFDKVCAECQAHFHARKKAAKFCRKECRFAYNQRKYQRNKNVNPAHYQDLKGKRNRAWIRFYTGATDKPPKLRGRKTKTQIMKVLDFERSIQRRKRTRAEREEYRS